MATCGEDEFGNVYAEVCREEVGACALRGCGSLYWSYEDDSDSSTDVSTGKVHAERPPCYCHTESTKKHCYQCTARAQSKLGDDNVEGEGKATFMHSGTCEGVSPAQGASNQDHRTEIANSKHCLRDDGGATIGVEDMDTDSDDDLHIVLNPLEGGGDEGTNEDSEDGEDFVILAGNEAMNDREWQEESQRPLEDKARALLEGGEKPWTLGDEKGQNQKSPRVQPHIGYGSQVYHRHYQYVRGSGPNSVGANVNGRVNGKHDRFGGWRGLANRQRLSLPTRGSGSLRGLSCGLEYCIPANKTVFDVDIDALQEKPWRLSQVDVSDYFNFGFNEASWKDYCKQLAQFCLEITTQSKISVYEGGRVGQSTTSALHGGRGCEPWSSANTEGLQIRETDAIFLIDGKDYRLSRSFSEGHSVDSGEVSDFMQNGISKSDVPPGSERGIRKTALQTVEIANQTCVTRPDGGPQKCDAGLGNETQVIGRQVNGNGAVCLEDGLTTPSALRPKTLSPPTPPERIPTQDKRDTEQGKSQSSSLNDGSQLAHEDHLSEAFQRNETGKKNKSLQLSAYVKACGRQRVNAGLTFSAGKCFSGKLGMKRCSSPAITSRLSKKRRLGSQKVNSGAYHSLQPAKKLSRPQTAIAVLGPYNADNKAETTQQKKPRSINNAVECLSCDKSIDQYVNGAAEQPVFEKAERRAHSIASKTDVKSLKRHGETDSSKVRGQWQGVHCESAEEKSKEELKAKKPRRGHKCKERSKHKGCLSFEKEQVEGLDKTLLIKKRGAGTMSMISFVSKDNCFYWKKVGNMTCCNIQHQDLKNLKSCHEIEQKSEEKIKTHKRNKSLLGHLEIGGDKEIKNKVLQIDGNSQREAATSWNILKSKAMLVKHSASGEYSVPPTCTESQANSRFETHATDSMHAAFNKQVSTRQQQKNSESKEKPVICKHSLLDAESKDKRLTDVGVFCKQSRKKSSSKKLGKSSCKDSKRPMITCLGQQKQDNVTLNIALVKDTELMNGRNGVISPLICGRSVCSSDSSDKDRKAGSKICQSEMHSPKAHGNKLPNIAADTLNDSYYVGFGTTTKSPNVYTDICDGKNDIGFDISRLQENHSPAEGLINKQESIHATLSESSEEDVKQRGRSKFERWTSHSEQATHDSCFDTLDTKKVGRICLSRKIQASKFGQCLKHLDELAPEWRLKQGDNCAVQSGAQKNWGARKQKGKLRTTYKETENLTTIRQNEHESAQQQLVDHFVAKLERRRERFKLPPVPVEEEMQLLQSPAIKDLRESLQRSCIKAIPFTDRVAAVNLERPARKRCWGRS